MEKKTIDEFQKIIETLHGPNGCPWDKKQTIPDYKKYLIEEAYELCEAIDEGNPEFIKEEIGDVLLILTSLSYLHQQKGLFDLSDAIDGIAEKMIVRHPHVFGDQKVKDAEEVLKNWMQLKAEKKQRKTVHERLPKTAPALLKSAVLFKELKHIGKPDAVTFESAVTSVVDAAAFNDTHVVEAVLYLAKVAYDRKIDLEEALRARILSEALKHHYEGSVE
jgi:MazG family protein